MKNCFDENFVFFFYNYNVRNVNDIIGVRYIWIFGICYLQKLCRKEVFGHLGREDIYKDIWSVLMIYQKPPLFLC